MNEYLKPMQMELDVSDDVCELLEAIGIVITSRYGEDCHNYGLEDSPIDIALIDSAIFNIRDTEFLIENYGHLDLEVCQDTIYEWASIIVDFWRQYPD